MLETTPIARPVIFTLAGIGPGERCVIERTETTARIREHDTGAANDWFERDPGWEGRIGVGKFFNLTFAEAAERSAARHGALAGWTGEFERDSFSWVAAPVHNPYTRLAVEMCPARGLVRAVGYEPGDRDELARLSTVPREVVSGRVAA
jgi:hypothetical protein